MRFQHRLPIERAWFQEPQFRGSCLMRTIMRTSMLRLGGVAVAIGLVASVSQPAQAQAPDTCKAAIEKTKSDWQAIKLQPASKPSAVSHGIEGHQHVQAAVDSMRLAFASGFH